MTVMEVQHWHAWRQRRDEQAFEALVRPHLRFLQDFARRLGLHAADADDVVQSVLVDLASETSDRPQRVGLRAWLGRSARSHALMLFRSEKRRIRREAKARPARVPVSGLEVDDQVQAALGQLDENARQAVVLRYLHDLDYREIAHVLKVSETGCRIRVHRAIARLRRSLGESAPALIAALPLLSGRADARAALARASFHTAVAKGGLLLMSVKVKIATVLIAASAVGLVGWQAVRERAAPPARAGRSVASDRSPPKAPAASPREQAETHELARSEGGDPAEGPVAPDKGSVRGTVRFLDGSSAEGLRVGLWGSSDVEDVTDGQGRFFLHNDWVGPRALHMKGPNDYMFILSHDFEMEAGEVIEVVVDLQRGVDVQGRVIADATGEPLAGAQVTLRHQPLRGGQGSAGFVKTDAEGRFAFRFVPRTRYSLDFVAKGYEAAEFRFDLVREQAPELIRLVTARPLVVRIEDLPEAAVGTEISWYFTPWQGAVAPQGSSRLSEQGELLLDAPPAGKYNLVLFRSEHLPRFERDIEIGEQLPEPIVFRLQAGARVRGTLRDAAGTPMPNAVLWAGKVRIRTGDGGRFSFARVPGGLQLFRLGIPDGLVTVGEIDIPSEGEHEIDLALPGTGAIVGEAHSEARVTLHAGDKPTNSALLQLEDPRWIASLDRAERFRVPHLAAGTYVLVARVFNGDRLVRRVTVGEGETVDLGDLDLRVYPKVPIRVSVPAGARLPAYVHVSYRLPASNGLDEENWAGGAAPDEQGRAWIHGPAPGTQRVTLQAEGFESCEVTLHVAEGMAPVPVQFGPAQSIR